MKNLIQKRVAVMILAVLLFGLVLPVQAASTPAVVRIVLTVGLTKASVNGMPQTLDATPFIRDNRTYVPVRFIAESMGAKVGWVQTDQKVTIELNKNVIWLWIGKKTAQVDGKGKDLDAPPVIENSRTFVPVRFVTENLGSLVEWDGANKVVTITYKNPAATPSSAPTSSAATPVTPVAAWMLTDDQLQAALSKGNSFFSGEEFVNYLLGDFGTWLPDRSGVTGAALLMTPYARTIETAYDVKTLNADLANLGFPDANLSYTLADAKKEAPLNSHELKVMLVCYGNTENFYKGSKCQLKLASGTTLQPKGEFTLDEGGLTSGLPPRAKYGAVLYWSFDTTQIPRDTKLDIKFTSSTGENTASFDLGWVK